MANNFKVISPNQMNLIPDPEIIVVAKYQVEPAAPCTPHTV